MWSEIDLANRLWVIPSERMKGGREHRVPLSIAAVAILDQMQTFRSSDYAFPGARAGKPLSNMAMLLLLRRMKRDDITAHGFRSTFRDWVGEATNFPSELAEIALAHKVGDKTEQAYRRGDALEKRVALMEAWSAFCTAPADASTVIPIGRGK
jgi:integrase